MTHRLAVAAFVAAATVGTLLLGALVPATAQTAPRSPSTAATWSEASARLGTAGSLWEPNVTFGLRLTGGISVLADNLTFASGAATGGDTFAGAEYVRGNRSLRISQKWADTGWAAEPAYSTSMALVGNVRIPLVAGDSFASVRAKVYANCFPQPANADPRPIPAGFRCKPSDVKTTGGVVVMTARLPAPSPASARTSIVLQSTGLSYDMLMIIAMELHRAEGSAEDGAGSAQMMAMCEQMVRGRMTFAQAEAFAQSNGYIARVGSVDGVPQAVTSDYRPDRFTVALVSNSVASCTYG